jgi:hypothetical protein
MIYLIYETKEAATDRADKQGEYSTLSHWVEGTGTRWLTAPVPTADGKWALDVHDYILDELEQNTTESSYLPLLDIEEHFPE